MRSVTTRRHSGGMRLRGLLLSALFSTAVWWAAQAGGVPAQLGGTSGGPLPNTRPAAVSQGPVVSRTVQPGDTIWSIARRVQPQGDVRPVVDRILSTRGGRPLQVGEEITVPLPD